MREGLAESRTRAQALILAGRVLVDDAPAEKPGLRVKPECVLRLRGGSKPFASRGGEKLAGALQDLGVDPSGLRCLDVGASTGGFTDCLLRAGAREVVAVDVGYGQLDGRLREDPRVIVLDRTHARDLTPERVGPELGLGVCDVSFISLRLVLPALVRAAPEASWLLLVKPQFEVGRERVGKGGVVREDADRMAALAAVREAAEALGLEPLGHADSRLTGPAGNREIFLLLRPARRVP